MRPSATYQYLNYGGYVHGDGPPLAPDDVGVALAEPFQDASVVLTPWGASVKAQWRGIPPLVVRPANFPGGPNAWPTTPDLQRFDFISQLGRDIRVELVRKGYLLPLGVPASLVTLTERRFIKTDRGVLAVPIAREFIICQPRKAFPAVNQPREGRDFPARRLVMRTLRTPDLVSPKDGSDVAACAARPEGASCVGPNGRVFLPGMRPDDLLYWPRTAKRPPGVEQGGGDGDVEFKWSLDEDEAPIASRLLFMSQNMLDSPALGAVCDYYNGLFEADGAPSSLRTARLNGARRRYAAEASAGEASLDTDSWVLRTTGRESPDLPKPFFAMDPKMNGADQPPFYPVVESAQVNIQSLDRLLGRPQGLIKVGYNDRYLRQGFDPRPGSGNPAELYLDVLTPAIMLNVDADGPATGGIARPNSYVAALSRKNGLIGAQYPTAAKQALLAGGARPPIYDLDSALNNSFDPASFFKGGSLLGVINLADVITKGAQLDAAPKLLERVGYGAAAQTTLAEALQRISDAAKEPLADFIAFLEKKKNPGDPKGVGQRLYPTLYGWLIETRSALAEAMMAVLTRDETAPRQVARLMSSTKSLLAELEHVRRDPVPAEYRATVDGLAAAWEALKAQADESFTPLAATLYRQAIAPRMLEICHDLDAANLGGPLLGTRYLSCAEIIEDPTSLGRLPDTLFSEAFGAPLAAALTFARELEAQATGRIIVQERLLLERVEALLRDAADSLIDRLQQPSSPEALNILNRQVQQRLAQAAFKAAATVVDTQVIAAGAGPAQVRARLTDMETRLRAVGPALSAAIDREAAAFVAKAGEDVAAIIATFKAAVIDPATNVAIAVIDVTLQSTRKRLDALIKGSRIDTLAALASRSAEILPALARQAAFAQVAQLGRKADLWCHEQAGQTIAPLLDFADDAAGGLLGDLDAALAQVDAITAMVMSITPPPTAPPQASSAKSAILGLLAEVHAGVEALKSRRAKLHDIALAVGTDPAVCADIAGVLDHVEALLAERARIADLIARSARWLSRLKAVLSPAPTPDPFKPIASAAAKLLGLVTSVQMVGGPGVWVRVRSRVEETIKALPSQTAYLAALNACRAALAQEAITLRAALLSVNDPEALESAARSVGDYARQAERALIATTLEAVALPEAVAQAMVARVVGMIAGVAETLAALHDASSDLVALVERLLNARPFPVIPPQALVDAFQRAKSRFENDRAVLHALAKASDVDAASKIIAPLADAWSTGKSGLADLAIATAEIINSVLRADLRSALNLDERIAKLRARLSDLVSQLVPTRIDTEFSWGATLSNFSGGNLFGMESSSPGKDLVLATRVSADFINNSHSVMTTGKLAPFKVVLFTPAVATITFDGAKFESRDGRAPHFEVKIRTVELGSLLDFIKPLQAWLAPSGSGFYVRPTLSPAGIDAGYVFAAGLISIGNLQFLNVSFSVGAILPFVEGNGENDRARFIFSLGASDRPFLIACAPYGGGGYISLTCTVTKVVAMELGFRFGGVAAIEFGPLKAHGRIVTGIDVRVEKGLTTLTGIVEAVGEGNIGCFGICVYIRVAITQRGSNMYGEAWYGFSFKVGFLRFHYSFKAQYNIQGGPPSGGRASLTSGVGQCAAIGGGGDRHVLNKTPRKAAQWTGFKDRLALDLLEPAK